MFKYRMYGSAVVSLPLIALIAMAISISVGTGVGESSAYGVYGNWVIGGCVVALIAQLWGFLRALRRVRRALRALSRGPMLVWLYLLVLLVQYGWSRDMASLVMAGIVLGIALLTHLAVRGSRRGRVTIDHSSSVGVDSVSD
jgi:dipeptide/tripeptide permease